ncbi:hypothetical protein [Natronorubrum sulfidifaciens]|uniref:Uncharacterized protein n=1 Tax=Natronorubrum sulfidifaciens JCM 14089 TaxID=1230460 RepID=L9WE84_9EURY|nr:hypothetical protein [Natronorubrum sulfidifaciens]ELY47662.1 hypothetical protein C495_05372 [Natronorubrum sulfidifaciens JCM 14089]
MIDRNSRIVFGSLLLFVLALAGSIIVELQYGIVLREYPILSFLLFAGVAIAAPQLYLAATDDDVPPRTRVQFAAVATAVLALAFAGTADGGRSLLITTIGACAVFGLVCYELLIEYRASSEESPTNAS